MVTNGVLTEIGDRVFLNAQIAVFGTLLISGFTEDLEGVTTDRFFTKKFKWSKDNLNWSEWDDLTIENVQQINDINIDILFFQFYYERTGAAEDGFLAFRNLVFEGEFHLQVNDYFTTSQSIFKDLIANDSLTYAITNNLLKKIYKKGILPSYLIRGEGADDADFIDFWHSVCKYFSLFISLADKFDNILNEKDLLSEYLSQRGFAFVKDEITLQDLQYMANNFFDEMRKRGTMGIMLPKGHVYRDDSVNQIDGEWLRALSKNHYDEFLVEFIKKEHCGFFLNQSCNLYNGTNQSTQLNKTPENTKDFLDLDLYDVINPLDNKTQIVQLGLDKVLRIESGNTEDTVTNDYHGLGADVNNIPIEMPSKYLMTVDTELDYELTFRMKRLNNVSTNDEVHVGMLGYNLNNFYQSDSLKDFNTGLSSENFISRPIGQLLKTTEWYFFRCILYAKGSYSLNSVPVAGVRKLQFNQKIDKVAFYLMVKGNDEKNGILVHDLKFRPLIRGKGVAGVRKLTFTAGQDSVKTVEPISIMNPCFLQNDCSVLSWTKNNTIKPDVEIENFVTEFLLPYQKNLYNIRLSPKTDDKQLLT